jgi:glycosyltransferase involved in cell wall biosynthesis
VGESCLAGWIREYGVGWVLKPDNLDDVVEELLNFSRNPKQKNEMFKHCHEVYQARFSRKAILDKWDSEIRELLKT